jgi:hypothetical protein
LWETTSPAFDLSLYRKRGNFTTFPHYSSTKIAQRSFPVMGCSAVDRAILTRRVAIKRAATSSHGCSGAPSHRFKFEKRGELLIATGDKALSIIAVCVSNPDRSSLGIDRGDPAPTPAGSAELVRYEIHNLP